MRILILNWRDIKHPWAGGAERMLYELARRWVNWGNEVVWFASNRVDFAEETVDGIKIIRRGKFYTVHLNAFFYYWKNLRGKFDVMIDNFHFIPFFTPLYVKEKKIALICEVAQEIWGLMAPIPFLDKIGRVFEKTLMFAPYKNVPFLTISNSTRLDLVKFGVPKENINVIPMGITLPPQLPSPPKELVPTLIFVGRLAKTKGIEDAVRTMSNVKCQMSNQAQNPNVKFWVIGKGEENYVNNLKNLVRQLDLMEDVEFLGFVSEKEKFERMARAHIILVPSIREGWGLIVPEAGAVGTPAVVYNSPGLRDVVKDGETGLICQKNTPENLAQNALRLLQDKNLYEKIRQNTIKESRKMTWDKSAKFVYDIIQNV